MKKLLASAALMLAATFAYGQGYNHGLGLRFNHHSGSLTYKYFKGHIANDFTLYTDFETGMTLTYLYELNKVTSFAPNAFWYYGLGPHVSLYGSGDNALFGTGLNGVFGFEYVIQEVPFAISLDYIPSFWINHHATPNGVAPEDYDNVNQGFTFNNWSIGIRYTFGSLTSNEAEK